ncbi:hypothetical protein HK405_000343, partial [Cladochytrium tenue]
MAYNSQFGGGFPLQPQQQQQQQQQRARSLHSSSRTSSPRAPSLAPSDQGSQLQQQQQVYYYPADAAMLHQASSASPSTPPQFGADQFTQQQYAMYVHQKKLAQLQHQQQQQQQQMMFQQSPTTPPFQPVMQSYQQAPIQPFQQWYGSQSQFDPNYQPYPPTFQPPGFGPQYQYSDQGSRRPPLREQAYSSPSELGFTIRRQSLPSHQIISGPPSLASSADVVTRNAALAQDSFYALMKSRPDGGGYGSGYGSNYGSSYGSGYGGGGSFVAARDPYLRQDVGDVGALGNQPPPVDWFHMPEPAASSHPSTDDGSGSAAQFPIDAHAVPRAATLLRSAVSMAAMSTSSESTNSTHPLIRHSPSDPVPGLLAGRPVVELVVLLGPRGSRAPSLLAQLQAQMPPEQFPQLRLIGSAANRYAGVGEYWDAAQAQVVIEGNVPLGKSVKRLRGASAR